MNFNAKAALPHDHVFQTGVHFWLLLNGFFQPTKLYGILAKMVCVNMHYTTDKMFSCRYAITITVCFLRLTKF